MSEDSLAPKTAEKLSSASLDQWRGLALIFVLINHGLHFTDRVNGFGRVGVNLFFFISGILVFRSLKRSRATSNWQRSRSFWWRRLQRLYPALLAYVFSMLVVTSLLGRFRVFQSETNLSSYLQCIPFALTYLLNYPPIPPPLSLQHLWSLGCEMQFYLLAPLLWTIAGTNEPRKFGVFILILAVLLTLGLAQPFLNYGKYSFEFAVWPMMLGFFCEYRREWFAKFPPVLVIPMIWISFIACGSALIAMLFGFEVKLVVIAIGALLLLPCFLTYHFGLAIPGAIGHGLEWLGTRTYSIYLWQQPFALCNFLPNFLHPAGALIAVWLGGLWFRWFEFPFLSSARQRNERAREIS